MAETTSKQNKGPPKRFRNIAGVRRFVARVLWMLEEGKTPEGIPVDLEPDKARCMLYGAKILAELIETSKLERRVEQLEAKANQAHAQSVQ